MDDREEKIARIKQELAAARVALEQAEAAFEPYQDEYSRLRGLSQAVVNTRHTVWNLEEEHHRALGPKPLPAVVISNLLKRHLTEGVRRLDVHQGYGSRHIVQVKVLGYGIAPDALASLVEQVIHTLTSKGYAVKHFGGNGNTLRVTRSTKEGEKEAQRQEAQA